MTPEGTYQPIWWAGSKPNGTYMAKISQEKTSNCTSRSRRVPDKPTLIVAFLGGAGLEVYNHLHIFIPIFVAPVPLFPCEVCKVISIIHHDIPKVPGVNQLKHVNMFKPCLAN